MYRFPHTFSLTGIAHRNIKLSSLLIKCEDYSQVVLGGFNHSLITAYLNDADIMRKTVCVSNLLYRAPEMHSIACNVWPYDAKGT